MLGVLSLALAAGAASGLARVTVRTVTFILVVVSLVAAALGFRLGLPPGQDRPVAIRTPCPMFASVRATRVTARARTH